MALISTLRTSSSWEERRDATKALSGIKEEKVVEALIETLKNDDEWAVRFCAAEALGNIGDERAFSDLSLAFQNDENQTVQEYCAQALANYGTKAIDIFSITLQKHDKEHNVLRSYIVEAIYKAKDPVFQPLLLEALHDPADWVVKKAVWVLGELGDPSVSDNLIELLGRSSDPTCVAGVKHAFKRLGIDADKSIATAERKEKERFLNNLKALREGMSEDEVTKLVGGGTFQAENNVVYKTPYGEFQLIVANGRLVEIPEAFGPSHLIREMEAKLSR